MKPIDLLVIAAHPDDAELGVGGTLLQAKALGHRTGIVDLTRAELSSRGDVETRAKETVRASEILGLDFRENLGIPDGRVRDDDDARERLVDVVRRTRPRVMLAPWRDDLHPDHAGAGELAWRSLYASGIGKFGRGGEPWRPRWLGYYMAHVPFTPHAVVDVTPYWDRKMEAVRAYASQFHQPGVDGPATKIASPHFMEAVRGRARDYGAMIGVEVGEPLHWPSPLPMVDLFGGLGPR